MSGRIEDWTETEYHQSTALSATGAGMLLPPNTPAHYRHWADNPQPESLTFTLGKAAHRLALGTGPQIVRIEALTYHGKDAKTARDEAYAAGALPVLAHQADELAAMMTALGAHPIAGPILNATQRQVEVPITWTDDRKVRRRARLDALVGKRMIVDYKTTAGSAHRSEFGRSAANYGYLVQAGNYVEAAESIGIDNPVFVWVVQEKQPPYEVAVYQAAQVDIQLGRDLMDVASKIFAACTDTGHWPGHTDQAPAVLDMPEWWRLRASVEAVSVDG